MNDRAIAAKKLPARESRTIRIKKTRAVETGRKPNQAHRAVNNAREMSPTRKWAVSSKSRLEDVRNIAVNLEMYSGHASVSEKLTNLSPRMVAQEE